MTEVAPDAFRAQGTTTPVKLQRVAKILPWVIRMAAPHVRAAGGVFWYIDANAGPGTYTGVGGEALEGSPLLALEALRALQVSYRAVLIDHDPMVTARLQSALVDRGFSDLQQVRVLCEDNRLALPRICAQPHPRKDRGLIFFDAQKAPDFPLIDGVMGLPAMRHIDALVNVPTWTLKLERSAAHSARFGGKGYAWDTKDVRPLSERLGVLHKQRLLIGEPTRPQPWSLILGSNWPRFPEWTKGQFDAAESPIGQERLERISLSQRELREAAFRAVAAANYPYFEGLDGGKD